MLHDRILVLVQYVTEVIAGIFVVLPRFRLRHIKIIPIGTAKKDHTVLRSLSALIASLPASEHPGFREEFDKVSCIIVNHLLKLVD